MPAYIISYDLRKQRNYDPLIKQLREWGCVSPLESLWLGDFQGPSGTIRDLLRKHMDDDDGIVVIEIRPTHDWAVGMIDQASINWIRLHIGL